MDEYRKYEPIFNSWYLSREIGEGSFGKVFEITRKEFGNTYRSALKIISIPQNQSDIKTRITEGSSEDSISAYYEEVLKEIVHETEIMSRLKGNSNIVSYEDHAIIPHDDGIGYDILIRMELLTPLMNLMLNGSLKESDVVQLGIDICKALELCHNKRIIHRDIKPQNIFISDNGDFKLGDFGIARTIEKTAGGMSKKGTYKYMAPEVFRGENYDSTVDIYSLGIVMYSLLNENRAPFMPLPPENVTPSKEEEAFMKRFGGAPMPAPKNAGNILSQIILKACSFYPQDRYQTAEQMRTALESYQLYGDNTDLTVLEPGNGAAVFREAIPMPAYPDYTDDRSIRHEDPSTGRKKPFTTLLVVALTFVIVAAASWFILNKTINDDSDSDTEETSQTEETADTEETSETEESAETEEAPQAEQTADTEQPAQAEAPAETQNAGGASAAQQTYPAYNSYGYHTFYFDNNGGSGEFAPIEVAANTYFTMPSSGPYKEGSTFRGWYVQRLSDGKWYSHELYQWIDWDGYSEATAPYIYVPGISLLYDDSWEKTGGSGNSNYVFRAAWSN